MEVVYKLNPDDVVAFAQHNFRSTPAIRRSYLLGYVWGPLGMLGVMFLNGGWPLFGMHGIWLWTLPMVVVCVLVYALAYSAMCRWNLRYRSLKFVKEGRNAGIFCQHRMTLDADKLIDTTGVGETSMTWRGIERVEESAAHIFIYIAASTAFVIPKWAFDTEQCARGFFDAARTYQRKADYGA